MRLTALLLFCPVFLLAQANESELAGRPLLRGKLYVAEAVGEGTVYSEGRALKHHQTQFVEAAGTIILTKERAHAGYVFSNGTGMLVDEDTRVEVARFDQEHFAKNQQMDFSHEPSRSTSHLRVSYGLIGICTNRLISGSQMRYATPLGVVGVNNHARMVIHAGPRATSVFLLEGTCTVASNTDPLRHSVTLRPGEKAVIDRDSADVRVSAMEPEVIKLMDDKVATACHARQTVAFDVDSAGADAPELRAHPVVPSALPNDIVVSPSRIY